MNTMDITKKSMVFGAVAVFALFFGDCCGMRRAGPPALYDHNPGNGGSRATYLTDPVVRGAEPVAAPAAALAPAAGNYIARVSPVANILTSLNTARAAYNNLLIAAGADIDHGGLAVLTRHAAPDTIFAAGGLTAGAFGNAAGQIMFNALTDSRAPTLMNQAYADPVNGAAGGGAFFSAAAYSLPAAAAPAGFETFILSAGLPGNGAANSTAELVALSKFVIAQHNAGTLKTYVTSNPALFPAAGGPVGVPGAIQAVAAPATSSGADVNFLVCLLFKIVADAEAGAHGANTGAYVNSGGNNIKQAVAGAGYTPNAVLAVGYLLDAIAG